MTPASSLRLALVAVTAAGAALVAGPAGATGHGPGHNVGTAAHARPAFGGTAYGSSGHFGKILASGKSALVPMCTTKVGAHTDATQRSSNSQVGSLGSVHTSMSSQKSGATLASIGRASTSTSKLFSAMVSGKAFVAQARATSAPKGNRLIGTTTLTDVRIAGHAAPQHPTADQKMALPGVGSVVLNHQRRSRGYGTERITVTALTVNVQGNNSLGLPAGKMLISRATATLHRPTHRQASGNAYGSRIVSGDQVKSGKTAPIYLPCGGSNGGTRRNNSGATSSQALQGAATHTTARSTDSAQRTMALVTSTISGANLLGGVIKADTIVAHARATRSGTTLSRSSSGTSIGDLTINGQRQSGTQPVNTKHAIPGIGTLWIHRVIKTPSGLQVYALQLILSRAQDGLSKGSVITLGAAKAQVAKT